MAELIQQPLSSPPKSGLPSDPAVSLNQVSSSAGLTLKDTVEKMASTNKNGKSVTGAPSSTLSLVGLGLLFLVVMAVNLFLVFRVKAQLAVLAGLKKDSQTQQLLTKANLDQKDLDQLKNLDSYFFTKERVVSLISLLNQEKANFKDMNFTFLGEEPVISNQKYIPIAISAVGSEEEIQRLLKKMIDLDEPIDVVEFETKSDLKNKSASLVLKINIYVRNNFTF